MRRSLIWTAVFLAMAAAAIPAAAAPRVSSTIKGTVTDVVTGLPFPDTGSLWVDVFETTTLDRTRVWVDDPDGHYEIAALPAGTYKVRFRYFDGTGTLLRYRWNDNKGAYNTATPVVVGIGATVSVDAALSPFSGATASGTLTEARTGLPLGAGGCFFAEVFEKSGISVGILWEVDAAGSWDTDGKLPTGRYTVLAGYSVYAPGCEGGPTHLDTWYGGASGYPLHPDDLSADPATFATADLFTVVGGVPLAGVDIAMLPAPTCRGKQPTIFGTTLSDTIVGTAGRDIISGLAGKDTINGGRQPGHPLRRRRERPSHRRRRHRHRRRRPRHG